MFGKRKPLLGSFTSSILTLWTPEIMAFLGSTLFLFGLIILVAVCDSKPIFNWYGLSLNTVMAILATLFKACLLLAIEGSISQWKWTLFWDKKVSLIQFERIDRASRGPWGSLQMIWQHRSL
jgi:hypothetical protein